MKAFLFIAVLFGALSVQAADRKLGNVILVERDIENVYDTCIKNLSPNNSYSAQTGKGYFFCNIQITRHPAEVMLNKGGSLRSKNPNCIVDGDFGNGSLLIFFASKVKDSGVNEAKRCLAETVAANPDMVATIQTVEP